MSRENLQWPTISYFHEGRRESKQKLAALEFIQHGETANLYRHKHTGEFWRLDSREKFDTRYLTRVPGEQRWQEYDATEAEKALLFKHRGGEATDRCRWSGCASNAIKGSAFCLDHTFQMGVRE